jgi:predicted TIM-barrel fold metal-dependent hydrolase
MDELTLISVDDHLHEPPGTFADRLPERLRERGPRLEARPTGDVWVFDGDEHPVHPLTASAGRPIEEWGSPVHYDEMRPAFYDPVARLGDMDADGVAAALCFPSFSGFSGTPFVTVARRDPELALLSLQAYNDFVCDEWCAAAPGRYIPLVLLPLWDQRLAAQEVLRTAEKGARAIAFSENPVRQGLPSIHDRSRCWDPVLAAAQETAMPLCMHIGSSSHVPKTAPDSPRMIDFAITPLNATYALTDWLMSGHFERFPGLVTCYSEGGIGWMPWVIERCDYTWERHRGWVDTPVSRPPSTYVADHVMGCLIDDRFGGRVLDVVGARNVMVETDYPHPDGSWPNSRAALLESIGHLDDETLALVCRGNAERVFHFTPTGIGRR